MGVALVSFFCCSDAVGKGYTQCISLMTVGSCAHHEYFSAEKDMILLWV